MVTPEETMRSSITHRAVDLRFGGVTGNCCCTRDPEGTATEPENAAAGTYGTIEQKSFKTANRQLYNMRTDPDETTNLIEKRPEVVSELTALAGEYVRKGRSTPGPRQKNRPAELAPTRLAVGCIRFRRRQETPQTQIELRASGKSKQ